MVRVNHVAALHRARALADGVVSNTLPSGHRCPEVFLYVSMIVCLGGAIVQGLLLFVCAAHSVIYFDVHDDCLGRAVFSVQVNVIAGKKIIFDINALFSLFDDPLFAGFT